MVTKDIKLITPIIAKSMLDCVHGEQRRLSPKHVDFLASEMEQDRWQFNGDAIRFDCNENLVDGQHRLHAVVKCGKAFEFLLIRNLPAAAMLTIDLGCKNRKASDLLSMQGVSHSTNIASALALVIKIKRGVPTQSKAISTQVILDEYSKCLKTNLHKGIRLTNDKFLRKLIMPSMIIGLYYLFSLIDEEKSDMFMETMRRGESVSGKRDAAMVLRETFFRIKVNSSAKTRLTKNYELAYLIKAWNFYINDVVPVRITYDGYREKSFPVIKNNMAKRVVMESK